MRQAEARETAGVRVLPAVLRFPDARVGETYRAPLCITNISSAAHSVQVRSPACSQFTLNVTNPDKPIAPGLQVTAIVEYQPIANEDVRDKVIICVDGELIEIPVLCFIPTCLLEMDSEVDFGTIIANSKVISKEVGITNHGSSPGAFKIKYSGSLPISIVPSSGMVEPKTTQLIKVDLCTDQPRLVEEMAKVNLQGRDNTHFLIKSNVVEQVLELVDMSNETLGCIDFGFAYFGTSRTEQAILYNNSPEVLDWVAVLEDDAPGVELGTDLQKSTDAFLQNSGLIHGARDLDAANLIFCTPNQGTLLPFQKAVVTLRFSPKQFDNITVDELSSRQDYALFMRFEPVGSKDGFLSAQADDGMHTTMKKKQHVELGLKGTGLPVNITFNPGPFFNFNDCLMGERIDILSSLKNESWSLPVAFSFRKIPHFQISPAKSKIQPGGSQDVILSFAPHQVGTFKVKQVVDIIGPVTGENNSETLQMKAFHQISLHFSAVCRPTAKKIVMKINPGITPLISNATGHFVHAMPEEMGTYTGLAQVAMLNSSHTQIHSHQKSNEAETDAFVAFPNDRSASIRPSDRQKKYRTIFTKVERYNYVDPDFAYTDDEEAQRQAHKEYYAEYLNSLRKARLQEVKSRDFEEVNNSLDIGIKPASGLKPPKISITEIPKEQLKLQPSAPKGRLLTTRELAAGESKSAASIFSDGLNGVPSSPEEKQDCGLTLTPQQLHHIVVGPSAIDFGEVCVCSTNTKQMHVINNLLTYIWFQLEVDSEELQQTSPLSHVVPPLSQIHIPITFETSTLGNFKKSINYSINCKHTGHVLVAAKAVPVAIELSTNELVLCPSHCFLVETGFRTTLTLYNRRNHPAEFSWKPIITEKGITFSIRPARGTVDAFKDIECEVVWHPGFFSPEEGEFNLCVHHGNTVKLKCTAKLGPTCVQFMEQRLLFNQAPLGLMTSKMAVIQNTGVNHAFYQVLDVCPLHGMTITPSQGVVPVGGFAQLQIDFTPNAVTKFDTRVEVAVRNGKPLELRIGGSVMPPEVDISVKSFLFPGVYINSTQVIPFVLQNKGTARARVDFDMAKYQDFALTFMDKSGVLYDHVNPHLYSVELEGKRSLECSLSFNPKEVAAYDFNLPVTINFTGSVTPADSPIPVTPTHSEKHIVTPRPQIVNVIAPTCRVNATVLQEPLKFSSMKLEFVLPSGFLNLGIQTEGLATKKLELYNTSKRKVTWKLDLDQVGKAVQDGVFRFSKRTGFLDPGQTSIINVCFCPPCQGTYTAEVPVVLNDDPNNHFRPLYLSGKAKSPKLSFDPPLVILTPAPLDTETVAQVTIIPLEYSRDSALHVEIPELELENGDRINALSVHFPNGRVIAASSERTSAELICQISFKSFKPISFIVDVFFVDEDSNRFPLQIAGTAENCLLTVYPHLACHRTDQQVILRSGNSGNNGRTNNIGEALLRPCYIPATPSLSTSSSSFGAVTISTSEDSASDGDVDNNLENEKRNEDIDVPSAGAEDTFARSYFPEEDTDEMAFFQKVVTGVQTWFSLFGWANGSNPISIPQSLRSGLCKIQIAKSDQKVTKQINLGKQTKTVYDMLFYLSGQMLPGITASQSLPSDPTDRVLQLHWQHTTLLTFLKNQGASLSHIKPEFLLEPDDYKKWVALQVQLKELQKSAAKNLDTTEETGLLDMEDSTFDSVSKRVWTDVLLQIYKVLILSRVPSTKINNDQLVVDNLKGMPRINPEPLSSNIYSPEERALLTWLNVHYEKTRKIVWKDCQKGDIPTKRWIVNFERDLLDGLVLAALLSSYCPFLISTHFVNMYTHPYTPEQCLHNCLLLVNAFRAISLDIDVQATDICDPNPIVMLMLCVYLYEKMPMYIPKKTVEFDGSLHSTVARQVRLKNPSAKSLVYNATILGRESADFSLPQGNTVTIAPKSQLSVSLAFTSHFLDPAEATLLLVCSPVNGAGGTTMAFSLKSQINSIVPTGTVKYESPCYELNEISLLVQSPFNTNGRFRIILVESASYLTFPGHLQHITKIKQDKACSAFIPKIDPSKSGIKPDGGNDQDNALNSSADRPSHMREFFCPLHSLDLKAGAATCLKVDFLPFDMGKRYCTIILMNEQIGDFVYLVEGTGAPPLPAALPPVDSPNVLHISSVVSGHISAQQTVCFRCSHNSALEEELRIPLINEARERALAIAAQKQMTALEYERRKVTGTLESSSVRAAVAAMGLSRIETQVSSAFSKKFTSVDYSVEVSMPRHFEVPRQLRIPVSAASRVNSDLVTKDEGQLVKGADKENTVKLLVRFVPGEPGRYPCQIVLRSSHDVRVYAIECVVNASSAEAELEFITPAHQPVIQHIPICNMTQQDWKLQAALEGDCFYGPPLIYVKAGETSDYSLMFKPISKCVTQGRLILRNETDGTEHIFNLKGVGQNPLSLDHVAIDCQVKQITQKVLMVPNYTDSKLTYKVASDLPMVGGPQTLTVKPGLYAPYDLTVSPWKRGLFTGVISFVVEKREQQQSRHNRTLEETDGEQALQKVSAEISQTVHVASTGGHPLPHKVWFSLEVNSIAASPEGTLNVTCAVLDTVGIEIPITNPTHEALHLDVLLEGTGLTGDSSFVLRPKETLSYVAMYSPTHTGITNGSVIFQSDAFGEFWYALQLTSEKPAPVTMPEVRCELGKWTRQCIPLTNPTRETLELETVNNNPGHFSVEIDPKKPLMVGPHSTIEVPVKFCPSALGRASHRAAITFKSQQIEEWTFHLLGVGLIPQPMESASISTCVGCLTSIIISFKNPTDEHVLIDVLLTDQEQTMHRLSASVLRHSINKESAFCLPLKQAQGISLAPKEKLDIPVLFAPDTMKLYEALVVVHMVKQNGENWPCDNFEELNTELKSISRAENGDICGIRWIYPVHGIPEAQPSKSAPAVVCCQARSRTEERMEVLLTGAVPGQAAMPTVRSGTITPHKKPSTDGIQDELQITEGFATTEEFLYEIQYESEQIKYQLKSSVVIGFVRKERDAHSGIVTLTFNIIFAPSKPMKHSATLVVQCVTGGIWKFPIMFVATEPNVDDVINIEATGLNKESVVGFRLTSQTRYPEPFTAYFLPGSDKAFAVSPQAGELLPLGTTGTLITVGFKPDMYSKKHSSTLIIQTAAMQWTYEINGLPPQTTPPTDISARIASTGYMRSATVRQRNFIRENLKLDTTAVSSPIKGAALVLRTK